jgi:hypothetical protein
MKIPEEKTKSVAVTGKTLPRVKILTNNKIIEKNGFYTFRMSYFAV